MIVEVGEGYYSEVWMEGKSKAGTATVLSK